VGFARKHDNQRLHAGRRIGRRPQFRIPIRIAALSGVAVRIAARLGTKLHMSNESLLIISGVGLIAGWLAGQIVQGTGFGIVGDLIIGIVGAFIGSWLLPQLGIHLGSGIGAGTSKLGCSITPARGVGL